MTISAQTRKLLWSRAHDICSFTSCWQALTADQVDEATGEKSSVVNGEEAHIRSPRPGGPRHDSTYSGDVDGYDNLLLLCPTHHSLIDKRNGDGFDVKTLIEIKNTHEKRQDHRDRITKTIRGYVGKQYDVDDRVLFEQVELHGPSVDVMFVDVPFACRPDTKIAEIMERIAAAQPGDQEATQSEDSQIVTGAAQAILHPEWTGNALLVGGPGQGKSTLLQYVCQFHRARMLDDAAYSGAQQKLSPATSVVRVAIRLDLRRYAEWATQKASASRKGKENERQWRSIEQYIVSDIKKGSGGHAFTLEDLAALTSTEPVLIALDGLDEVANIEQRSRVSEEIVSTNARLKADARDLVVLVATRPGLTTSSLWSSREFPRFDLRRLSQGLRVQYLRQWSTAAGLNDEAADRLQTTFMDNHHVPHIRELASYPMQLAILLHLLYRRQLLPQQRTELYAEYLKTFLDREQSEDKEPLLSEQRDVIVSVHAYLGWYLQTRAEEGGAGAISRVELKALVRDHLEGQEYGQDLADRLFSAIATRVLCLVERDTGKFQFEVQSLREYFAALFIFENAPPKGIGNSRDDCLDALLERPYWSNVCRFFVGMFSKVEVRGIRHNLRNRGAKGDLALHPMLRSMAALFLDDRTYAGQADVPIQEVVDFVLHDQGVFLADDGLLDINNSSLHLSERAGRAQAVRHLKSRLSTESSADTRTALSRVLQRHARSEDKIAAWWWEHGDRTQQWLETASDLGAFAQLHDHQSEALAKLLDRVDSPRTWLTALLIRGSYDGRHPAVLTSCRNDLNEGAGDALATASPSTPVGRLVECAALAQSRARPNGQAKRTRMRERDQDSSELLADVTELCNYLRSQYVWDATSNDWFSRLARIEHVWGDGWVLRQAVASVPSNIELGELAIRADGSNPTVQGVASREGEARAHRGEIDWWRDSLTTCGTDLERRHWMFSILTVARMQVIVELSDSLVELSSQLSPREFRSLRGSLAGFMGSPTARELVLNEPLRLRSVNVSPRLLWLIRPVATEATKHWIDRRIVVGFQTLLEPGMGDMRELVRTVGAQTSIKADLLRHGRSALPLGGWASDIKVGAVSFSLARAILQSPGEWPGDLVQRGAEKLGSRVASQTPTLAATALTHSWFTQ